MFERSQEYLDGLSDERVVGIIKVNQARLEASAPGTEPYITSEERLRVFGAEATKRGIIQTAGVAHPPLAT